MNNVRTTSILTTLHALVDALCACCVFMVEPGMPFAQAMAMFVVYNALAFVTQPLIGAVLDRMPSHPRQLVLATTLLVSGGVLCVLHTGLTPFIMVTLIGLGNSLFHVYGGRQVTLSTGNDLRHLGIFVSSGALGLAIGGQWSSTQLLIGIMTALLLLTAYYCHALKLEHLKPETLKPLKPETLKPASELARVEQSGTTLLKPLKPETLKPEILLKPAPSLLFAFIVLLVFFRSFLGSLIPAEAGQGIVAFGMLMTLLAVVGKATGGFIALRLGLWRTLTTVLLGACICFLLGYYHGVWLLAMVLLVNCSMPLTLHLANALQPRHEGFAFGMLAAVLAPGVGLAKLCVDNPLAYTLLYPLLATIVIEALVLLAWRERRWQVLSMSVIMNVLTNVPLNLLVLFCLPVLSIPMILVLEGAVILIETLLYLPVTHQFRQAFTYSLSCNVISYLLGLGFEVLI